MFWTRVIFGLIGWALGTLLVYVAGWDEIRWIATAVPILCGVVIVPELAMAWMARREKR
jgi:hypothetical protein